MIAAGGAGGNRPGRLFPYRSPGRALSRPRFEGPKSTYDPCAVRRIAVRRPVTLDDFLDEFLVSCPRCDGRAIVMPSRADRPPRLACVDCGHSRPWRRRSTGVLYARPASTWPEGQYALGDGADPYFHLPLWLQAPSGQHVLWAFNPRHLALIRDYVSATDRRTLRTAATDPRNTLLGSRLPRWLKLAKNRKS